MPDLTNTQKSLEENMSEDVDMAIVIGSILDEVSFDNLVTPLEIYLILQDRGDLYGFYEQLRWLHQLRQILYKTQKHLANRMGYAEKTFMTKRDELIKVGLLKIEKINRNKTQKITFCKPKRAPELNVP